MCVCMHTHICARGKKNILHATFWSGVICTIVVPMKNILIKLNYKVMFEFSCTYCIFDKILKRSVHNKISKNIEDLNNTINQLDLIDTYIILHPTPVEYRFFSSIQGIFTKGDHILGHGKILTQFERMRIIQTTLSNYDGVKSEIHNRKISGKYWNIWKLDRRL